MKTELFFKKLL